MCGICGIVDYGNRGGVNAELMRHMSSKMLHRGPDDCGEYIYRNNLSVGLGHRRLSIIDLSSAARQPISNEDGTIWVVFNGEIYNYRELSADLERAGHALRSHSDTEVLVHLYEEHAAEAAGFLRGMFAFAVWDEKAQTLMLARDRIGKKPLIYHRSNDSFCFASEFAALFASGIVPKKINYTAIHYYLTFGYIPAPLTIYEGVYKLMPAHLLILQNNNVRITPYWHLEYEPKLTISEMEAENEIMRLLRESVKIRLNSDVPLGAFLSGGIDSSTVVGLMAELSPQKVKTFTIGFKEQDYSEVRFARSVAQHFATEHHEFIVSPKAMEILPLLVERYGEPYADSSCIPTFYVAQQTRKFVTVALTGDGGDENFAGYDRYHAMVAADFLQRLPFSFGKALRQAAKALPDSVDSKNILRRLKRFFQAAGLTTHKRYLRWIGIFDDFHKSYLYSGDFSSKVADANPLDFLSRYLVNQNREHLLDRLLDADTHTYLPDDLLVKVDIASMANSLEARSPFLDYRLMEFVARLPVRYKLKRRSKKYILKRAVRDLLPYKNIYRRKMGFGLPVGLWLRNEMKDFLSDTLLSNTSLGRGYFNPEALKGMVKSHIAGRKDYSFNLWALLMLELWHRQHMD